MLKIYENTVEAIVERAIEGIEFPSQDVIALLRKTAAIAFQDGILNGLWKYAWWKDGTQYVGTCGATLKAAAERVRGEFK